MRLLVTGGCGFIGSNFLHHWTRTHPRDEVVNLDALTYAGNPANVADLKTSRNYRFVKGDIADPKVVARAIQGVDVIVHFAAESHVDRSIGDAAPFLRTNVAGTLVLLEAARKNDVSRFHHVSTDEVFGDLPIGSAKKFDEESPYRPSSPYAASKAAADHFVRAFGRTYGLKFTITNGSNNFGPYQHPEKAIPRFILRQLAGQTIPLYGSGTHIRDWLHVDDYCQAIADVLKKGKAGETYCVGGDNELSNKALALAIARIFGRGIEVIEHVADRPGHDRRYAVNSSKIRTELGWHPSKPFEAALSETVDWYRSHPDWWRPLLSPSPAPKKA